MQDCTQQQVRPKSIEVVIDASLERIAVSCAVANPTSKCGEMHVSLPAMEGWGYLYSEERVADYPRTETCELKAKAERIYKEANAAANTGASISQNSREMVARSFKCPAGDTAWVTFHFKLADPARCWKQQPVRAAAPGASPRHPKEALEYAIFTPPSDGADAVPFHLRVLRPEDDSLSFALPSSQAVEHEAETRNCGVYYVRTATADGRGAPLTLVGERPLVAEVAFPSPNLPKLLKVRVEREQWDECGDLGDAFNAAVKIQDKPTIKLLAHAPAHHPRRGRLHGRRRRRHAQGDHAQRGAQGVQRDAQAGGEEDRVRRRRERQHGHHRALRLGHDQRAEAGQGDRRARPEAARPCCPFCASTASRSRATASRPASCASTPPRAWLRPTSS